MYNYQKLLGKMKECGITQEQLANILNISQVSINNKLRNRSQFKQDEMKSILNILGVKLDHIATYFFSQ